MRKKGYRFLRLYPADPGRLEEYYTEQGIVPVERIRPEKMHEIDFFRFSGMVHFFYDEDKPKFLKPEYL
jgi:hypothetical protein